MPERNHRAVFQTRCCQLFCFIVPTVHFLIAKLWNWHKASLGIDRWQFLEKDRCRKRSGTFTSDSLQDMNFSTTCLRYSKFISLESFKSELLVTVTVALGTSEFARSSGTSLSGLIFYKKKKKTTSRRKREAHCRCC